MSRGPRTAGALALGIGFILAAVAPRAGAAVTSSTDPTVLTGESGSFSFPLITTLLGDATNAIAPEQGGDIDFDVDRARDDFSTLNDDFAVSEYPLSSSDQATAVANGRAYAYVPFAAVPVDIGTDLLATKDGTVSSYDSSSFLQDLQFTAAQLMFLFTTVGNGDHSWNSNPYLALTSASSASQCAQDQLLPVCTGLPIAVTGQSTNGLSINPILPKQPSATVTSLETYFANSPSTSAAWATWLSEQPDAQTSDELWPVDVGTQNDQAVLHALIPFSALSGGDPLTTVAGFASDNGSVAPLPSDWLSPASTYNGFQVPTAEVQNSVGDFVAATPASAQAALSYAAIDPSTNLVTFPTNDPNPAAYPLVEMSYLVIPTTGLSPAKDTALGKLIQFILGSTGSTDIQNAGAAPITQAADPQLYSADESIANRLIASATNPSGASTTSGSSSASSSTATSTTVTTSPTVMTSTTTSPAASSAVTTTSTTIPGAVTVATPPADAVPTGFTSSVSDLVGPTGGVVEGGTANTRIAVEVPAGEFSTPAQVTISYGSTNSVKVPSGDKAVASVAVAFDQHGSAIASRFAEQVPVSIESLDLTSHAQLLVYDAATKTYAAPAATASIAHVDSVQGAVTFDLTGDPKFALVEPSSVANEKAPTKSTSKTSRTANPTTPTTTPGVTVTSTSAPSRSQPPGPPHQLAFTGMSPLPLLIGAGLLIIGAESLRRRHVHLLRKRSGSRDGLNS